MSEVTEHVAPETEEQVVTEEPAATDVEDVAAEVEPEEDDVEEEVDEEVEPDLELAEPAPVAADLHPGRLASALRGPSHHDLNPAFAPR